MKYRVSGTDWQEEWTAHTGPLGREWRVTAADGTEYRFRVKELEEGVLRMVHGDETHTLTILPGNTPGNPMRFLLDDRPIELRVQDEIDRLTEVLGETGGPGGRYELRAVMPGIIRTCLVAEGDTVEPDTPVLLLEAMKMENEIRTPAGGTVTRLVVSEGQTVAAGELMAVIEAAN